jgi:alkanesulfonate monooxygenase SsuD/methylene tetrahydromethanopterin reductase-like flavin-dependent oxidoreductase (luciferase family)
MTALATMTERVRLAPNVLSLPLRPPAVLAKQAATLDVITGGRFEMGLGAGAFWEGITAFGGPRRSPGEAYQAFEEALDVLRGLWDNAGGRFAMEGDFYPLKGTRPGPAPAHRIPIWVGARGPRMLRLLGRKADGLLISYDYDAPEKLLWVNERIDEGAEKAGREPAEIRRGYNIMGSINFGQTGALASVATDKQFIGTPSEWAAEINRWHTEFRQDTFIFWPSGPQKTEQLQAFTGEVIPAVREALGVAE